MAENKDVVVITGSGGLIGSALIPALLNQYHVVGMDLNPPEGKVKHDYIQCDLTDEESVLGSLKMLHDRVGRQIASVIHLAGYYDFSGEPSPLYKDLTVEGTRRLLRGLQALEVEQFVFSSTHILLKPSETGEPVTEITKAEPSWEYPESKLETEIVIQQLHGSIPAVVLRVAGVYDENGHTVPIAQQVDRIARKEMQSYLFPGDPESGQAYVHVDDLVDCIQLVIEHRSSLPPYEVFLVAEPDKMTYEELQDQIGELIHGRAWPTIRIPKPVAKAGAWITEKIKGEDETFIRPWMIDHADDDYPVSIEHAQKTLGWNPQHRLRYTLPVIVGKMKQNPQEWRRINGLPGAA